MDNGIEVIGRGEEVEAASDVVPVTSPVPSIPPIPFISSHEYLERFQLIKQYTWTSSQTYGISLSSATDLIFPGGFFTNNTGILPRMKSALYCRPAVEILIKCCGSETLAGRLLIPIHMMPLLFNAYYRLFEVSTGAEYYELDAGENTSISFIVPYRSMVPMMDLTAASTTNIRNLFALRLFVQFPLVGFASSIDACTVSVYARLVDPQLMGSTNSAVLAQMANSEAIAKSKQGVTLSGSVAKISDVFIKSGSLPVVGSIASSIGHVGNSAASMFKYFGFDTPNNVANTQPVVTRLPLLGRTTDCPSSIVLGPNQSCSLPKDSSAVFDEMENMSIVSIAMQPFVIYYGQVTNTTTLGSVLFDMWLSPCNFVLDNYSHNESFGPQTTNTGYSGSLYTYYPHPIVHILSMVNVWRGTFRFRVSFGGPKQFRTSIRIAWDPAQMFTPLTSPSQYAEPFSKVYDVTGNQDIYFSIPYVADTYWLYTSRPSIINPTATGLPAVPNTYGSSCGRLTIYAETLLNGGNASVPPYNFTVTASMGPDFEVASPSFTNLENFGRPSLAQGGSWKDFRDADYPPFVGGSTRPSEDGMCNVLKITSVKQLASMLSRFASNPNDQGNFLSQKVSSPVASFAIDPFNPYDFYLSNTVVGTTGTAQGNVYMRANFFRRIKALYAFDRGSIRYVVIPQVHDSDAFPVFGVYNVGTSPSDQSFMSMSRCCFTAQVFVTRDEGISTAGPIITFPTTSSTAVAVDAFGFTAYPEIVDTTSGYALFNDVPHTGIDVTIPYSSLYQCQHNTLRPQQTMNDSPTVTFSMPAYMQCPYQYSQSAPTFTQAKGVVSSYEMTFPPSLSSVSATHATVTFPSAYIGNADGCRYFINHGVKFQVYEAAGDDYIFGCRLPALPMQFALLSGSGVPANRRRRSLDPIELDDLESPEVINSHLLHLQETGIPSTTQTPTPTKIPYKFVNYLGKLIPARYRHNKNATKGLVTPNLADTYYYRFTQGLPIPKEYEELFSSQSDVKPIPN